MGRASEERAGVSVGSVEVVAVTEKAVKVFSDRLEALTGDSILWVPKSQLHDDSEITGEEEPGEEGELVIKRWFAEREGLNR